MKLGLSQIFLTAAFFLICFVILPVDLLYLHYAGGWQEPNSWILSLELALLYVLPVFGVWYLVNYLRKELQR